MIVENLPLGIDQRVRKQVKDLLGSGYRVSVVTRRDPKNASYRDLPGLKVLDYPAPGEPRRMSGYVQRVRGVLRMGSRALHGGSAARQYRRGSTMPAAGHLLPARLAAQMGRREGRR